MFKKLIPLLGCLMVLAIAANVTPPTTAPAASAVPTVQKPAPPAPGSREAAEAKIKAIDVKKQLAQNPKRDANAHQHQPTDDVVYCYPNSGDYETGSCLSDRYTATSYVWGSNYNNYTLDRGFMVFDVSSIPLGARINTVIIHMYCYEYQYAYGVLTAVTKTDPRSSPLAQIYADLAYDDDDGTYFWFYYYSNLSTGWNNWQLSYAGTDQASIDLQNSLVKGWFAVGLEDQIRYAYYYEHFYGWNDTYVPYIEVDYTPPDPNDVGVLRINSPIGLGGAGLVPVQAVIFNYGTAAQSSFDVRMTIGSYSDVQTVASLASYDSVTVNFADFDGTTGQYTVKCSTELTGDQYNPNDKKEVTYTVVDFVNDFESDSGAMVADPVAMGWEFGAPTNPNGPGAAHSGNNVWAFGLTSNYPWYSAGTITTPDCKASADNPILLYYDWWATYEWYDGYNVKISTDDGATWTILDPDGGYNYGYIYGHNGERGFSGYQKSWQLKSFTLPITAGTIFKIRWDWMSYTGTYEAGVFIDDLAGVNWRYWVPDYDVGVTKILNPKGFWGPNEACIPKAEVANYGLLTQTDVPVRFVVVDQTSGTTVYDQSASIASLAPGETTTVELPEWTDPQLGNYYDTMMTTLSTDEKKANDYRAGTLMVVDSMSGEFSYCDDTPENAWAWYAAGNGWGVKFEGAGGLLSEVSYHFFAGWPSPGGSEFRIWVLDATGSGGLPGNLLYDQLVTDAVMGQWNVYDIRSAGIAVSGTWYVFYIQTQAYPNCLGMSADYTSPITTGNDFEYFSGVFGPDVNTDGDAAHDWMIRCKTAGYSRDAGITAINIPAEVDSGAVIYPQVVASNNSFMPRTFDVFFKIKDGGLGTVYSDSVMGLSYEPFESKTLDFPNPWNADPLAAGQLWTNEANTDLYPDYRPQNDTLRTDMYVKFLDARTDTILRPNTSEQPGAVPVIVRGRNIGNTTLDSMKIRAIITTPASDTVYDENRVYYNVPSGTAFTATMSAPWYPSGGGAFTCKAITSTLYDMYAADDIKTKTVYIGEVDAELVSIIKPSTQNDTVPMIPKVKVRNNSTVVMDIPVEVKIYKTGELLPIYTGTATAASVAIGASVDLELPVWNITLADTGWYDDTSRVTAGDPVPANDVKTKHFLVRVGPTGGGERGPWVALAPVPTAPSGKNPKAGSAAAFFEGEVYFLKGSGKGDFAKWTPDTLVAQGPGTWTTLADIPKGTKPTDGKFPKKGASMAAYNDGLYILRGANTPGFWKFAVVPPPETSGWVAKAPIPTGAKNPKDGGGMLLVNTGGVDYLFTMKGSKTSEFYLYDIANNLWLPAIQAPPTGASGKAGYKKGSCMAYDPGTNDVYVLKGQYGDFFKYNLDAATWTELKRYDHKAYLNRDGKKKKFGDGAAMVNDGGVLYAMKGGNTLEMWKYDLTSDTQDWKQADQTWDIPAGSKKVKGGGTFIVGGANLYATRGANTPDFFGKFPLLDVASTPTTPVINGVMANPVTTREFKLTMAPNPAINMTAVRYNLPKAGSVSFTLYNVAGATVRTYTSSTPSTNGVLMVDTKALPSGVYILRFNSGTISATRKLVIER